VELAESATAAGIRPDRLARLACLRPLQRMGEEIGNDELPRFAALQAAMESEFAELARENEGADAAHG
jgi:hypothetical protein